MKLAKTDFYSKKERKFFKKHPELVNKYGEILENLQANPFDASLKTHKLQGNLKDFYACRLTYEYRIALVPTRRVGTQKLRACGDKVRRALTAFPRSAWERENPWD